MKVILAVTINIIISCSIFLQIYSAKKKIIGKWEISEIHYIELNSDSSLSFDCHVNGLYSLEFNSNNTGFSSDAGMYYSYEIINDTLLVINNEILIIEYMDNELLILNNKPRMSENVFAKKYKKEVYIRLK